MLRYVHVQKQPFADVLENSAIFTGNHMCWNLFNKVAGLKMYVIYVNKPLGPRLIILNLFMMGQKVSHSRFFFL